MGVLYSRVRIRNTGPLRLEGLFHSALVLTQPWSCCNEKERREAALLSPERSFLYSSTCHAMFSKDALFIQHYFAIAKILYVCAFRSYHSRFLPDSQFRNGSLGVMRADCGKYFSIKARNYVPTERKEASGLTHWIGMGSRSHGGSLT